MTGDRIADRRAALGLLASGGLLATVGLAADPPKEGDNSVKLEDVPKKVKDAAERILPNATWLSAVKVKEGEKFVYELDGRVGKDKDRDATITVTEQGKVVEVETQIKAWENVPQKVRDAITKKWPQFKATTMYRIRQGKDLQKDNDGDHVFDVRGTRGAKEREVQVQVSADGDILESTVEITIEKVKKDAPEVMKKLTTARPQFKIEAAYVIHEGDKVIGYHFEGKTGMGKQHTISVTPDGKQIEVVE